MKVFGLFGEKLSHSLSPNIHNKIYQALGIDAAYSLFELKPQMLHDAVQGIRALNIDGVNVTIPYKVKIMDYLDNISDEALRIGAINTILNYDGKLSGYNTDYVGFGRMLKKHSLDIQGKTAVVLGTGGAAKSVITYLEDNGISDIYIISRTPAQVSSFNNSKYKLLNYNSFSQINHADMLINCTPCGMYPNIDCSPIEEKEVFHFSAVIDLIYNPRETLLLRYAKKNDIAAINGLYMLVAQAASSVEIWTGNNIEDKIIENVYLGIKQIFDK